MSKPKGIDLKIDMPEFMRACEKQSDAELDMILSLPGLDGPSPDDPNVTAREATLMSCLLEQEERILALEPKDPMLEETRSFYVKRRKAVRDKLDIRFVLAYVVMRKVYECSYPMFNDDGTHQ